MNLGLTCNNVVGEGCEGYSLFTNFAAVEKEKKLERTVLALKDKFVKNSMLRAIDLEEGATAKNDIYKYLIVGAGKIFYYDIYEIKVE